MERVYLLHGFMGTAQTHFGDQISHFEEKCEVIPVDLPGHGANDIEAAESYFEEALSFIISLIKEKGPGYLVGLSLGASLAIHTALKTPGQVKGIVLTGYSPLIPEDLKPLMETQYEYFFNIEENDPNAVQYFSELHGVKWKQTLHSVLHTMTYHYPSISKEDIQRLSVPVLILNGSSERHEADAVSYFKETNAAVLAEVIPNAGHTANMDQPDIYNKMLEDFLN